MNFDLILTVPVMSILAFVIAGISLYQLLRADAGTGRVREIAEAIWEGANAYLSRQYKTIWLIAVVVAVALAFVPGFGGWKASVTYIFGAACSSAAGFIGMYAALKANSRTLQSVVNFGIGRSLQLAFRSGLITGMCVVGFGLLGVFSFYVIFKDPHLVLPFSFGASTVALFARVGGGIYTKTADVGADLVGKVEAKIPEDDPRNPAVIADNIGDNVGDVAGMGADLFESYVASMLAAMIIGYLLWEKFPGLGLGIIVFPLVLRGFAILASALAALSVSLGARVREPSYVLTFATILSSVLTALFTYFISQIILEPSLGLRITWVVVVGLIVGMAVGLTSDYFTNRIYRPAQSIAHASQSGPAITVLTGFSVGMFSTIIPVIFIAVAIIVSYYIAYIPEYGFLSGIYGITMADVGMLSITGIVVASDAYGPVVDNAAGMAEMSEMPEKVRDELDILDSVGNTTKAICKGFAIGSAALTAIVLFATYAAVTKLELSAFSFLNPHTFAGVFIGCALTVLFMALVIQAVSRNAFRMVEEVRRQFREIPGILEGNAKPDYARCVDISTKGALKELVAPGLLALLSPVSLGMMPEGKMILGGFLAGSIVVGLLFGLFMANAGGAWDNAKKYIELGHFGGKRSPAHAAAVIGDTIGDPFKDTAGPSLNIMIKLIGIVALHVVPLITL
ncbi:MAG: sodium-translocating pyrophosphatase [Nitrososphaerota archaeon]|nr:sodium-translocating pyrophosphatase [Nitrososphaerales archaeon]MDW8044228.1 sodium-translocating pyrophosphatase [Nitrososphaerota archaeon]